jgi:hypothetical protein
VATGLAGLGALLLARATDYIEGALGLPREQARLVADGVSSGALGPDVPTAVVTAARQGLHEAFSDVLILCAGLALLGALLTALLVRGNDLIVQEQ